MKKYLLFVGVALIAVSCGNKKNEKQEQVEESVVVFIKDNLEDPNSYESVSFEKHDSVMVKNSEWHKSATVRKNKLDSAITALNNHLTYLNEDSGLDVKTKITPSGNEKITATGTVNTQAGSREVEISNLQVKDKELADGGEKIKATGDVEVKVDGETVDEGRVKVKDKETASNSKFKVKESLDELTGEDIVKIKDRVNLKNEEREKYKERIVKQISEKEKERDVIKDKLKRFEEKDGEYVYVVKHKYKAKKPGDNEVHVYDEIYHVDKQGNILDYAEVVKR